jgi:hypothetical protein
VNANGSLPEPQALLPCWYGQHAALAVDLGRSGFDAWPGEGFTPARPAGQPPVLTEGWLVVVRRGLLDDTLLSGLLRPGGTWWWAGRRVEVHVPQQWLVWARTELSVLLVAGDLRLVDTGALHARASIEIAVRSRRALYGRAGLLIETRVGGG